MNKKKILVVDDDKDLLRGLIVRLKAGGYEVICANDCVRAVSAARTQGPDLILLDIGLPGGDGYVVMERLRMLNHVAGTPIIVLSAKDPETHRERTRNAGASAFFQKPVDNAVLMKAIRQALGEVEGTPRDPEAKTA